MTQNKNKVAEIELSPSSQSKLADYSLKCLVGYLSSGRKMTVENGREVSIEEAAILRAKTLLTLLEKEK